MKFNEYLIENEDINKMILKIYFSCLPFLKELRKNGIKNFLYRGTNKSLKNMSMIIPRKNREPSDMRLGVHNELDNLFKKRFGWKPRSEGVFATFNYHIANEYGNPYLFFPIGEYKYIFSPKIEDLFTYVQNKDYYYIIGNEKYVDITWHDEYNELYGKNSENGEWYYKGKQTGKNDIKSAIKKISDIYDLDEEDLWYYLEDDFSWVPDVSRDAFFDEKYEDIKKKGINSLNNVVKKYVDRNLKLADKKTESIEIMFKCNKYYMVYAGHSNILETTLLNVSNTIFNNLVDELIDTPQIKLPLKWRNKK